MKLDSKTPNLAKTTIATATLVVLLGAACGSADPPLTEASSMEQSGAPTGAQPSTSVEEVCAEVGITDVHDPSPLAELLALDTWLELSATHLEELVDPAIGFATVRNGEAYVRAVPLDEAHRRVFEAAARPNAPTRTFATVTSHGEVGLLALLDASGDVHFYSAACGLAQMYGDQLAVLARWLDESGDVDSERSRGEHLADLILLDPLVRSDLIRAFEEATAPSDVTDWPSLPPSERHLTDAPVEVQNLYVFLPNVLVTFPVAWSDSEALICTRLADAWAGHSASLSLAPESPISLYVPRDGANVEFWLVGPEGRPDEAITRLGVVDSKRILDTYSALNEQAGEIIAVTISASSDLADVERKQDSADIQVSPVLFAPDDEGQLDDDADESTSTD